MRSLRVWASDRQSNSMKVVRTGKACFVCLTSFVLGACAPDGGIHNVATGGLIGGVAGAGTGALVGAVIANGDIAASAALGGIIGIPIGIAAGIIYDQYYSEKSKEDVRAELIRTNHQRIFERERQLEALREQINSEAPRGLPDPSLREKNPFVGPSLGNYYR